MHHRLVVVSAPAQALPAKGQSIPLEGHEISIGRQSDNVIVLSSVNVSKRHCSIVLQGKEVLLKDQGSSNGTFVNGVLSVTKKLKEGDRISVGDFVLELAPSQANVIAFPGSSSQSPRSVREALAHQPRHTPLSAPQEPPQDLKGKAQFYFEHKLMPKMYDLNTRYEWKSLAILLFLGFFVLNLYFAVSPIVDGNEEVMLREISRRAKIAAESIAHQNANVVASEQMTKASLGYLENYDGLKSVLLVDMDLRILAPGSRSGSFLTNSKESIYAVKARKEFNGGRETGLIYRDPELVVAVEPIKVLNPQVGSNQVKAMAIVSIDPQYVVLGFGEVSVIYSKAMIIMAVIALLLFGILYRITFRPIEVLTEEMDRALKGEPHEFKQKFKYEEMGRLWDLIDSSIRRIQKSSYLQGETLGSDSTQAMSAEDYAVVAQGIVESSKGAVAICDEHQSILYLNPLFEEITGLRSDQSRGQGLAATARDQAFSAFVIDIFGRTEAGRDAIRDQFEFRGINYQVRSIGFGPLGSSVKCFVMILTAEEAL